MSLKAARKLRRYIRWRPVSVTAVSGSHCCSGWFPHKAFLTVVAHADLCTCRPLDLKLPRSLLGWEIATAIIKGSIRLEADSAHRSKLSHCSIHLRTSHASQVLRHRSHSDHEGGNELEWKNERLSLPVKKRFASPLVVSFKSHGLDLKGGVVGMGVLWLMTVPDNERLSINLPSKRSLFAVSGTSVQRAHWSKSVVYEAKDYNRLEQNFWTYCEELKDNVPDAKHYAHDPSALPDPESFGLTRIGTVHFELLILPGISSSHRRVIKKEPRGRIIMEGFDNAVRAGLRDDLESDSQIEREDENYPLGDHADSLATRKSLAPPDRRGMSKAEGEDEEEVFSGNETDASAATYSDEMVGSAKSIGSNRRRRRSSQSTSGTARSRGYKEKYRDWKETRVSRHRDFGDDGGYPDRRRVIVTGGSALSASRNGAGQSVSLDQMGQGL